jgi:hypothetical protein
MRTGYVALLSLVVAYSAYQGTNAPRANPPQRPGRRVEHNSENRTSSADSTVSSSDREAFPAIARGIVKVAITQQTTDPCPRLDAVCPARELRDLMGDYFQPQTPLSESPDHKKNSGAWGVPSDQKNEIKFIIATLPDPVHTHMALWFDRWVDAIEKASQAGEYLFSRAWMPWDLSTHPESTDFTVRMAQAKLQESKESLPGLMIFRKTDRKTGSPSTLFVFVVGETPTGGLHVEQFQNALYIRQSILTHSLGVQDPDLLIFGPTFSGSLQSLAATLNAIPHEWFSRILIRSGSVSSYSAAHDFCEATQRFWPGNAIGRPEFTTFQFSNEYEEFFLSYFFLDRHETHSHVAVLSEDETEFGNQEKMSQTPQTNEQVDKDICPPNLSAPLIPLTRLYFPRDIAELRDAYQQNVKVQSEGNSTNNAPSQRLPLTLGITGNDDDSIAAYASLQTPLSQESIMQAIVSTLRQRHAKVVIIRATNTLDMVFLARYLRQNYPQARLVTSLADLLMVYDVTDPRFHGILAATSYPLLNGASFPTQTIETGNGSSVEVQRTFSDSFTLGAFNAFLSLLPNQGSCDSGQELGTRRKQLDSQQPKGAGKAGENDTHSQREPIANNEQSSSLSAGADNSRQCPSALMPSRPYSQFGFPSFLENKNPWRPRLWLTTVGRDGYWPIAVLDDVRQEEIDRLAEDQKENEEKTKKELEANDPTTKRFSIILKPLSSIRRVLSTPARWYSSSSSVPSIPKPPLTIATATETRIDLPERYSVHFSVGWAILWVLVFALTVFVIFLFVYEPKSSHSEILARFAKTHSRARDGLLFTGSMLLLTLQTLFVFPIIVWLRRFGSVDMDAMWVVWFFYVSSTAALAVGCLTRFKKTLRYVGFIICLIFCVVTVAGVLFMPSQTFRSEFHSFIYRYIHVESGVSPLLPLFFGLSAWLWWCWQSLTGVASTEEKHMVLPVPSDFDTGPGPSFTRAVTDAYDRVRLKNLAVKEGDWPWNTLAPAPSHKKITIYAAAGWLSIFSLMRPSEIAEAFEPLAYKVMYWIVLYSCLFLICYLVTHIVVLWLQFRNFLRAIERLPFRRGFGDLKHLTWKPLWKLAGSGRQDFTRVFGQEVDALRQIKNCKPPEGPLADAINAALSATEAVSAEWEWKAEDNPDVPRLFSDVQQKMAKATSQALIFASEKWKHEEFSPSADSEVTRDYGEKSKVPEKPAKDPILRAVEYFLCLFYLNVVLVPLRRLQTLILAMAGVFVFALMSYSSYPFESRESFHALLISILFAISLAVGIVYGQMYANPLLSRITNTKPGELGLDFWVKLGTFVFVPLLSLLSVQFPEINSFLFSWLQPALQSVK